MGVWGGGCVGRWVCVGGATLGEKANLRREELSKGLYRKVIFELTLKDKQDLDGADEERKVISDSGSSVCPGMGM